MSPLPVTPSRLVKPTLRTKFRIDFDWWDREKNEFRVYLRSHLCPAHQQSITLEEAEAMLDLVDEESGEVRQLNGLHYLLITHCTQQPEYFTRQTTLVDAIFRVFMANGNQPLTPEELAERIGRPGQAATILKTIGSHTVYKGLRPLAEREG